jgi:mannose-6-phosphate isomerase-like protein (cupin superfamily)
MIFVQTIMGKLGITFDGVDRTIKEGNCAFFDGGFSHAFFNPQHKDLSFLLVIAPSFLGVH